MTVHISTTVKNGSTRMTIAGRLTQPNVRELEKACSSARGRLVVDVSDLRYADDVGVSRLLQLTTDGAQLEGASPFVELLLEGGHG